MQGPSAREITPPRIPGEGPPQGRIDSIRCVLDVVLCLDQSGIRKRAQVFEGIRYGKFNSSRGPKVACAVGPDRAIPWARFEPTPEPFENRPGVRPTITGIAVEKADGLDRCAFTRREVDHCLGNRITPALDDARRTGSPVLKINDERQSAFSFLGYQGELERQGGTGVVLPWADYLWSQRVQIPKQGAKTDDGITMHIVPGHGIG